MNKKLLNYFFGGRLFNFTKQNFEKILFDPKKEKKFHLFPEIIEYYPLFQVIVQPTQSHLVILSPIFRDLSQIIKLFEKYGFVIQIIRTLSAESFAKITKEDEKISTELSIFIDEEKLNKFCFSYEEENKFSNCIFMIVDGPNLNFLKKKLLKKVIIHNKDFYPSRKHLFYESTKKEIVLLWQNFLGHSIKIQHPNFTKCIYFIIILNIVIIQFKCFA